MKKTLSYAIAAILLGTVTMLVPMALLGSIYYDSPAFGDERISSVRCLPANKALEIDDEARWGFIQKFGLSKSPLSNILPIGLMLIPSFLLALGVSLYLKKRIF